MSTATVQVLGRRIAAIDAELTAHRRLGTNPHPQRREDVQAELNSIVRGMEELAEDLGAAGEELLEIIGRMKPLVRTFEVMHDRNGEHSVRVDP